MKQTNNAIKFLMAQYRAIFNNAYFKGLASAALVTVAMAAGQANATTLTGSLVSDAANAQDIIATGNNDTLTVSGQNKFAKTITVQKDAKLTISGNMSALGDVNVNGGTLIVSGSDTVLSLGAVKAPATKAGDAKQHYEFDLKATAGSNLTLESGSLGVQHFDIAGSTINLTSGAAAGTNLTAYGVGAYQNGASPENLSYDAVGKLTDVTANISGGSNITAIGTLNVTGSALEKSKINLTGNVNTNSKHTNFAYLEGSKQLNITKTTITVSGDSGSAISSRDLNLADSKLDVQQGTLTIGTDYDVKKAASGSSSPTAVDGTATIKNTNITVANGATLNFGASGSTLKTTVTGGSVSNSGTITTFSDLTVDTLKGWYTETANGKAKGAAAGTLNLSGAKVTVTGADTIDLSKANIAASGDASLVAEKSTVTIANGFESKIPTITASTIKAVPSDKKSNSGSTIGNGIKDGRQMLRIKTGNVTALNALEGSVKNSEVVIYSDQSSNASLTLGNDATTNGTVTNISKILVGWGTGAKGTDKLDINGTWNLADTRITANNSATVNINTGATVSKLDSLQMTGSSGSVNVNGTVNLERLLAAEKGATNSAINVNGTLNLTGDGNESDKTSSSEKYINDVQLTTATLNINAGGTVAFTTKDAWDDILSIQSGDSGVSTITVMSGEKSIGNTTNFGGWKADKVNLNAGGTLSLDLTGYTVADKSALETLSKSLAGNSYKGIVDLGGIKIKSLTTNNDGTLDYSNMPNVKTDATAKLTVNVNAQTAGTGIKGSMGSAKVESDTLSTATDSTLEFNNAVNGQFATNTTSGAKDTTVDVTLASGSALNLNGDGSLGDITKKGTATATAVVLGGDNGTQTVGKVDVAQVNIVDGNVTATQVTASGKSTVDGVLNVVKANGDAGEFSTSGGSIGGTLNAGTVSSSDDLAITGSVNADTLKLTGTSKTIFVGDESSNGSLEVGTLDLKGGKLLLDPAYGDDPTIVALKDVNNKTEDVVSANGDIGVGRNSILAIGTTADEAKALLTKLDFFNGVSLKQTNGAVLVANESLYIANGNEVILDSTATNADLNTALSGSDSFKLGTGSALVVTDNLSSKTNDGSKAIIEFQTSGSATVTLEKNSQIAFESAISEQDKITLSNAGGAKTDNGVVITAAGGLLNGTLNGSQISFTLQEDKLREQAVNMSAPVQDLAIAALKGTKGEVVLGEAGTQYIQTMTGLDGGKAVEETARLAVYGGVVQATNLAQQAANDAVVERMSRANPNGSLVFADNAQGGGLWLSPVYKSHESDSFDADGVDYGVDADLTGLVLGGDFTSESGVRAGAYFNFGSASIDGQGVGDKVSNDADYFGFGLYTGMTFGQMSLVADAGFTQVSNDIEQTPSAKVSKVKADVDSSAVTLGLRGEYKLNVATMDVTPHLGVRYTRLAVDGYDAKADGILVANTDFDTMQMFSVPFGVTISKDIAVGSWTIKPVFDLTLTANAGDTDAKLDTTFIGTKTIGLTSEAFDSFTYGATMGIDAKYGEKFSVGLNTNYVGSSNTDEFGVMGNVRYMF